MSNWHIIHVRNDCKNFNFLLFQYVYETKLRDDLLFDVSDLNDQVDFYNGVKNALLKNISKYKMYEVSLINIFLFPNT